MPVPIFIFLSQIFDFIAPKNYVSLYDTIDRDLIEISHDELCFPNNELICCPPLPIRLQKLFQGYVFELITFKCHKNISY